jgi:hypothetical protein
MRLRFEMSGMVGEPGAAVLDTEVEAAELPATERRAIQETLDAVMAGDDAGLDPDEPSTGVNYRLVISDEPNLQPETTELVFDDASLPVDLLPLIELLRDRAIDERIERNRARDELRRERD